MFMSATSRRRCISGGIWPATRRIALRHLAGRWRRNSNVDTRGVDDDLSLCQQRNEVLHRLAVEIEIGNFFCR
jgi:hypothetical protein